jgi:hypothetical protein
VIRIAGSLCARLTALDAIVGRVISKADNVSIVKTIPIVHPAVSSITNLTAVPSVAVSKLINLRTSMSFVAGSYFCVTADSSILAGSALRFLSLNSNINMARRNT